MSLSVLSVSSGDRKKPGLSPKRGSCLLSVCSHPPVLGPKLISIYLYFCGCSQFDFDLVAHSRGEVAACVESEKRFVSFFIPSSVTHSWFLSLGTNFFEMKDHQLVTSLKKVCPHVLPTFCYSCSFVDAVQMFSVGGSRSEKGRS